MAAPGMDEVSWDDVPESVREAFATAHGLEEVENSRGVAWSGLFFEVEEVDVTCPDGSRAPRQIVEHPGGACVLAVRDGRVCLVRQWRVPQGRVTLELPAGKRDAGEAPERTAARELREETGLVARELVHVASTSGAPGFTSELTRVFWASGLERGEAAPDPDEFVDVVWLPVDDVVAAIRAGAITDAKTICGVLAWAAGLCG